VQSDESIERKALYINFALLFFLIAVVYNYLVNRSKIEFYTFLQLVVIIVGIGNIISILQYTLQINWALPNTSSRDEVIILRAYGLYLNPNIAGYNAIVGLITSFALLLFQKKMGVINLLLIIVAIVAGIMTFSKTFFLNSFIVAIIYIYYRRSYLRAHTLSKVMRSIKYIILLPLFYFFYAAFSYTDLLDEEQFSRLETVFFFLNDSKVDYSGRTELADYGVELIKTKPIVGHGYGSFTVLKGSNRFFDFTSSDLGVHNTFLRIWGEGGIISFIFYFTFWFYVFYKIFVNKSIEIKMLASMLFSTLFIYSLTSHNIPEDYYAGLIITIIFYLISTSSFNSVDSSSKYEK
jgi:O-antigen ligase